MALALLITDFDLSFGSYVPIGVQLHGPNRAGTYLQTFQGLSGLGTVGVRALPVNMWISSDAAVISIK